MAKIKELSWSLSRARMFEECPRRLYYHSYFAQAGYAADAPEEARLALEMKKIKGLDMWVGEVVHDAIQWALEQTRCGNTPKEEEIRAETRRRLSDGWRGSVKQLWRTHPEEVYPNLFEHYYGMQIGDAATDRLKNKAFLSIHNFANSELFERISKTTPERWLPIEKFASFRLDGLLMFVKFDFAMKDGEQLIVYDWKTGNPSADQSRQLACYALYTASTWKVPLENVKACTVYLQPEIEVNGKQVTEVEIDDLRTFVKQSFNGMVKCLRNPARNLAAMDDFPMTGNLSRCARCNFRGLCSQGKMAAGDIEDLPIVEDWED